MVVALRAGEGQAEDRFTEGLHAVGVIVDEVLGGDRATLVGVHVVALEAGRDQLTIVGVRHEVAGDLFRDEAVVGFVVVEGLDDPVAPEPEVTASVDGEAVGVGVAGGIQPIEGHAFAEVGTGQQAVDESAVGVWFLVMNEGFDFGGGRGQAGQVQRHATDEGVTVGFGRRSQAGFGQLSGDPVIDGRCFVVSRQRGSLRGDEGPVLFILRTLLDPGLDLRLVGRRELQMGFRRRHHVIFVSRKNAFPDDALV